MGRIAASSNREEISIEDGKYTYVFEDGRVSFLRNGQPWVKNPELAKVWIATAGELEELREKVATLEATQQKVLEKAAELENSGHPATEIFGTEFRRIVEE